MATVTVRYIVDDVDATIDFYCRNLGFHELMHPAATFAMLEREDLRLALSAPSGQGGGGQSMPDGTPPTPGGWNRFSLEVSDLEAIVDSLRGVGVRFRNDTSLGSEDGRSFWRIRPETPSSSSSPCDERNDHAHRLPAHAPRQGRRRRTLRCAADPRSKEFTASSRGLLAA